MPVRTDLIATLFAFAIAVWLLACSDRKPATTDKPLDGDFDSPYSGQELADKIQAAIDAEGAYTLAVQQTNFVLPQWGGSDGGTVTVGRPDIKVAVNAELQRTGDGPYSIWLREGRTTFSALHVRMQAVPVGAEGLDRSSSSVMTASNATA